MPEALPRGQRLQLTEFNCRARPYIDHVGRKKLPQSSDIAN